MKEFMYAFQVTRTIIFEVEYYTLGSNKNPYFSTCANKFNQPKTDWYQCGQCQNELLPMGSVARKFWETFDKYHLHDLTKEQYDEVVLAIEELKETYNYDCIEKDSFASTHIRIPFWKTKELSMQKLKKAKKVTKNG